MPDLEVFRNHLIEAPKVIDPERVHHEFADYGHGQKIDFDGIEMDSPLFDEWVDTSVAAIYGLYGEVLVRRKELLLLSVADGTNRLVGPVAESFAAEGHHVSTALTEKLEEPQRGVKLTEEAKEVILATNPELIVIMDDVGTSGSMTLSAFAALMELSPDYYAEVLYTVQRTPYLAKLIETGIPYNVIMKMIMPTYSEKACNEPGGFCYRDWKLIKHSSRLVGVDGVEPSTKRL